VLAVDIAAYTIIEDIYISFHSIRPQSDGRKSRVRPTC